MTKKLLTIDQAAGIIGTTARHVRRMCREGDLPGARKKGRAWRIPATADARLSGAAGGSRSDRCDPAELEGVPANKRDEALRRAGLIGKFERFAADWVRNGGRRVDAYRIFADQNDIGYSTLRRWVSDYRREGLAGLVDTRGGGGRVNISPDARRQFESLYLTQQQLSVKTCWQNIKYINKLQDMGWQIPSLRQMYRVVDKIPEPVKVLHREGIEAYNARCGPYVITDPESVKPGAVWVGDHHQFNCWRLYRGKWVRPWITAWMDMASRQLVGWWISACPNQSTILQAFKRACQQYGPPDSVHIDNGKDYDSQMWTGTTKAKRKALKAGYIDEEMVAGLYAMLDVTVSFAIPYNPQSKRVERLFDTVDMQFCKTFETYCGKDTDRRPDYVFDLLKKLSDSPPPKAGDYSLEAFAEKFQRYVPVYNNTAHTGDGMSGRSPAEVMASRQSVRAVADGVLELLCRVWSGKLKVGKNGVKFKGLWYGQFDLDLAAWQGKFVRLAYDPDDIRRVWVYDAETMRLITVAEQARLIGYGRAVDEEQLRFAMKQKARARKVAKEYRSTQRIGNTDITDLTIAAMEDAAKDAPDEEHTRRLRPVATKMDNQVDEHRRKEQIRLVKKAAGAEQTREVLDFDFEAMRPKKANRPRLFE